METGYIQKHVMSYIANSKATIKKIKKKSKMNTLRKERKWNQNAQLKLQ